MGALHELASCQVPECCSGDGSNSYDGNFDHEDVPLGGILQRRRDDSLIRRQRSSRMGKMGNVGKVGKGKMGKVGKV